MLGWDHARAVLMSMTLNKSAISRPKREATRKTGAIEQGRQLKMSGLGKFCVVFPRSAGVGLNCIASLPKSPLLKSLNVRGSGPEQLS